MLAAGIKPHFISSDIHQNSMRGPMYDLPTCLNKFLALGMSLDEVIGCTTHAPAKFLRLEREIGTLQNGAYADVAVFELAAEPAVLYDCDWQPLRADQNLRCKATFVGGGLLPRVEDEPAPRYLEWRRGGRDDLLYSKQAEVLSAAPTRATSRTHADG
jgi:dihydroorotase